MADGFAPILAPGAIAPARAKKIVVGFAGGGGSSLAISDALGRHPDAALNHWPLALAVHQANFPGAEHWLGDILETDCMQVLAGEEIGLAWFSPDCRHFSRAKGGTPVSARVRGLAWVVIQWAKRRRPDVIMMENVEEWLTWGPLTRLPDGTFTPDPDRKGQTADLFFRRFRQCGYVVEHRVSSAANFGDPTLRKRMLVIARCDGEPIVWPEETRAPRQKAKAVGRAPHAAAAEIIDFSRECPSIFLSREEARARRIKRPLEAATMRRIAKGLYRHAFGPDPFIISVTHSGERGSHDIRDGLPTVTGAHRGEFALVAPSLIRTDMSSSKFAGVNSAEDAIRTFTSTGGFALSSAFLVPHFGESPGQEPRSRSVDDAYPTVVPGGRTGDLVAALLEQANTGMVGHDARDGVSTIMQTGVRQRLVTAQLSQLRGSNLGKGDITAATPAIMANGRHLALLQATLDHDQAMAVPFADHGEELRAFLIKYYGTATSEDLADPLATATSRARLGLVLVSGLAFRVRDIGMRMLDPECELGRAMGFWPGYRWVDGEGRKISKTNITKMVGNAVCRHWASAHVAANCAHLIEPGHRSTTSPPRAGGDGFQPRPEGARRA